MYHFYLCLNKNEVRPMAAPVLPRCGDTIAIDGREIAIDKVVWVAGEHSLEEMPMIYTEHHIGNKDTLAVQLARQFGPDRRIAAIKEYRSATNMGLREAKDEIDAAWNIVFPQPSPF